MNRNLALCALTPALLFGCQTTDGLLVVEEGDLVQTEHHIFGGSAPSAARHDATVALHQLVRGGSAVSTQPFCSGTLIAPQVVLTAAHCLDVQTRSWASNFKTMAPGDLAIYVGDDPSLDIIQGLHLVTDTTIYPGYDRINLRNDLALVTLATPVDSADAVPVPVLPQSMTIDQDDVVAGTLINYTGFGQTEFGTSGVKLQVNATVDALGCDVAAWGCYGDPGDALTQFSSAQAGGGTCFGDSGGSGFVNRSGTWYVVGITSWGDQYCTEYGVNTNAAAFEGYILNYIGVPEPEVPPVADAGGPYTAYEGNAITFDGSGSSDANGDAMTYIWDFGDGSFGSGVSPTHTYVGTGTWTVTLTVTDNDGSDVATTTATVTAAPACTYNGSVSASNQDEYVALGAASAGQTFAATLSWDDGSADLDFGLEYQDSRGRWKTAATSATVGAGVFETISYTAGNNRAGLLFRWHVQRMSGATTWCIAP